MADALGNSFLIVVLPLYIASGSVSGEALGLSEALVTGLILALFGLVSSLFQPFAGRLSDRAGKRQAFVLGGLLLFGATNFAFSFAHTYLAMILIRAGQGLAAALTITASVALVNELSTPTSRGGNMGIYNAFRLVGFGAGPLASGFVIEAGPYTLPWGDGLTMTGFELSFYIAALAALVSAVLVALMVRDPEETQPDTRKIALRIRASEPNRLLDPIFTLGLATLFMSACFAMLSPIEPLVNTRLDQGPFLFSVEFAALVLTLAVAQPLIGRASDRRGRRTFIIIGLVALAPTTLAQGIVTEPWQMIAARGLQGIAGALVFAPALALAGDLAKEGQSGAQLSVLTVSFGLGIAFGQIAAGFLVRYGFVTPFAFGSLLALGGVWLVKTQVPMRRATGALVLLVALFLGGCATSEPATQRTTAPPKVEGEALVFGYHPYWLSDSWRDYDFSLIDKLFFFEIEAGGSGTMTAQHGWPERWEALRQQAQATSTPIVPTVTLFDRADFIQLFTSPEQRQIFLENALAIASVDEADGLHLDVEVHQSVPAEARQGFTQFVQTLSKRLKAQNPDALLSLFAPAFDREDVFDEAALASAADYLVVQGYDLHWRGSEQAGPVAPLRGWQGNNWQTILDRYLQMGVPRSKIVMSVPFYGYEWPTVSGELGARTRGRGHTISYAPVETSQLSSQTSARELAAQHGLQRDPASNSPYYAYQDSTGWHQGWFEDEESLSAKYRFVQENNLAGLAIFPLGYDDGELLRTLR